MSPGKKGAKKSIKKSARKETAKKTFKFLKSSVLITPRAATLQGTATLRVDFIGALGTVTATLFEHLTGEILGHDVLNISGTIIFNNANSGDTISVNGTCPDTATIRINIPTSPATPADRSGNINDVFIIL